MVPAASAGTDVSSLYKTMYVWFVVAGAADAMGKPLERPLASTAAMAARLHEELITAERAQRDVLAQRAEAERRREEADKIVTRLRQRDPDLRIAALREAMGPYRPEDLVKYEAGLRLAGLPD